MMRALAGLGRCLAQLRRRTPTFWTIFSASFGFSSRYLAKTSPTALATSPSTSGLFNRILVCASKCGFGSVTLITAVRPSRKSLPSGSMSSLYSPSFLA